MPEVSRFFGIIIKMFLGDHVPPHFHAEYGDYKATFDIKTGKLLSGHFPVRQLKLIQAWVVIHERELLTNFENLRKNPKAWKKIEPLQ